MPHQYCQDAKVLQGWVRGNTSGHWQFLIYGIIVVVLYNNSKSTSAQSSPVQ